MMLVSRQFKTAFKNSQEAELEFSNADGIYFKGKAIITSMSIEAGQDDVVSYAISFEGCGELKDSKEL